MIGSLPGAILDPGLLWAGQAGYSSGELDVWHWTVGFDSIALCRDNGLVQTLTRDEGIYQFVADLGMIAFTQCEHNRRATANEVESIDGSVTPAQLALMAYRETFVLANAGIPPIFYSTPEDGPRLPVSTDYRGVTTHASLHQSACAEHFDGFGRWVWDAITAPPPPPPGPSPSKRKGKRVYLLWGQDSSGGTWAFLIGDRSIRTLNGGGLGAYGIPREALDWMGAFGRGDVVPWILGDPTDIGLARELHAKDHGPGAGPAQP